MSDSAATVQPPAIYGGALVAGLAGTEQKTAIKRGGVCG